MEKEPPTKSVTMNNQSTSNAPSSSNVPAGLNESSESDDGVYVTTYTVVPLDGGWGWLVVASAFFCNMVSDGIVFNFGLIYLDTFVDTFDASKTQVSLVVSLLKSFTQVVGPFASALTNRYGFRKVAFAGGFISSVSFGICYFANSITFLCIAYGVVAGIGSGLTYMASTLCVSFYFQRWRPLAVCLASCGSNTGGIVMGPILRYAYDNYGWRNTMLLKSALFLFCSCLALLYRPIKATKIKRRLGKSSVLSSATLKNSPDPLPERQRLGASSRVFGPGNRCYPTAAELILHVSDMSILSAHKRSSMHSIRIPMQSADEVSVQSTVQDLIVPWFEKGPRHVDSMASLQITYHQGLENVRPAPRAVGTCAPVPPTPTRPGRWKFCLRRLCCWCRKNRKNVGNRPLYRDDIFYDGSTVNLHQYMDNISNVTLNLALTRVATKRDIAQEESSRCVCCPEAIKRTLATMLDMSLFKSPSFIMLLINCSLMLFVILIPFVYMPDRAKSYNMDRNVINMFVFTISLSGLVSKIVLGIVTSLPRVNLLIVYNCMLTVGGITMIMIGSTRDAMPQLICCVVFGSSMASFNSLRSLVVVQLLGLEKLTNAFGLMQLVSGIAGASGPPMAGWFQELLHSYDAIFWLAGAIVLLGITVMYPVNWINRREKARNKEKRRVVKHL